MNGMQDEINKLKLNIREMKNNELVDRELLFEINEFNRKVSFSRTIFFFFRYDDEDRGKNKLRKEKLMKNTNFYFSCFLGDLTPAILKSSCLIAIYKFMNITWRHQDYL